MDSVHEDDIVRKIIGNQQLVLAARGDNRQTGGIRYGGFSGRRGQLRGDFLFRRERLRRNCQETTALQVTPVELVDGDSVSGVSWLGAGRICNGDDRGVEVAPVGAERQPEKVTLVSVD